MTLCPLCNSQSITEHCEKKGCTWYRCINTHCQAVLDPNKRIGHYLHPEGIEADPRRKVIPRLRLLLTSAGWGHRD